MRRSLVFVCLLSAAAAQAVQLPRTLPALRPAASVAVNCNNSQSIQAAVDASSAPVEILITGICVENVLIRNKDVSLRGVAAAKVPSGRRALQTRNAATLRRE